MPAFFCVVCQSAALPAITDHAIHAIDATPARWRRGANPPCSPRNHYGRVAAGQRVCEEHLGRRAADRARSSRRRRGAGGRCRRPFLLRFVAFLLANCTAWSDVWPASQAACSVHSVWGNRSDAVFANSSSGETLIDAHDDLAMCCSDGVDLAPAKMSTGHAV